MNLSLFKICLIMAVTSFSLSSCVKETVLSKDGAITGFVIPNQNGYIELETRVFEISETPDEDGYYIISNLEPFPYGSLDTSLIFVFTTSNSNYTLYEWNYLDTNNVRVDTVSQAISGSASFTFNEDMKMVVYAQDQNYFTPYKVRISVEQINPEEIVWEQHKDVIPFDLNGDYTAYTMGSKTFVLWGSADESAGTITNELYSTNDGINWKMEGLDAGKYPMGLKHSIGKLNNELVCFSSLGYNSMGNLVANNDLYWTSTDGIHWESDSIKADQGNYAFHYMASLNGNLYAFGGTEVVPNQQEVQQATYIGGDTIPAGSHRIFKYDGSGWSKMPSEMPSEMPSRFGGITHAKGRIYLVNGEMALGTSQSEDVWATENGSYWLKTGRGTTPAFYESQLVYFSTHLWRIGGRDKDNNNESILEESIDDGDSWQKVIADTHPYIAPPESFKQRWGHQAVVDDQERLIIIGGKRKDVIPSEQVILLNEVWVAQKRKLNQ